MFDILRMRQLILGSILIMILFKVMNLILVLVITVMARSQLSIHPSISPHHANDPQHICRYNTNPEIRQCIPTITKRQKFLHGNLAVTIRVDGVEDGPPDVGLCLLAGCAVRLA